MKPSEAPTVKAKRSPLILVVGLGAPFVRRCQDAAAKVNASVTGVEAGSESAFAMQSLPIAVVMHDSAVASSPFGSVAGELGIELIRITDETLPDSKLEELITAAVGAARERWRVGRT